MTPHLWIRTTSPAVKTISHTCSSASSSVCTSRTQLRIEVGIRLLAPLTTVCDKMPYQVSETGWGEFTVQIKITFVPEAGEKALTLQHPIKLHHWGEPIEAPPPVPALGSQTPGATPGTKADEADVKMETATPKTETEEPEAQPSQVPTEASAGTATGTGTPAAAATTEGGTPSGEAAAAPAVAPLAPMNTIAAMYPVHAWQYDEVVFSDPPANFMTILEQHPPTPLPARNRRARDQREEHELRTGKKKARSSALPPPSTRTLSRAGTETAEGVTTRQGTPATPVAGVAIGAPGELGSADVPLEFTTDMEKGEGNRLTEVRIHIVKEMDRWR